MSEIKTIGITGASGALGKELTKIFEDTQRGKIKDIIDNYKNKKLKGEFVMVVKGLK